MPITKNQLNRLPKSADELPVMEANAREIHSIEFLAGLDAQLVQGQETLKERLQLIPGGWRNFRLAVSTTERVLDAIYKTLPDKTLKHMRRLCQCGQIVIRPKPAIKMPDDLHIVDAADLRMLINCVIENKCAICVEDIAGQKACALRKALHHIAPTEDVRRDGRCNYLDVAAGNELGKYI